MYELADGQVSVLVTGGAGFVGRRLVQALLQDGRHVRVLDVLLPQIHGPDPRLPPELEGAEFMHGDVRDGDRLATALVGGDDVILLAAESGVGQSMYEVQRYVDANDRGTACLLQAVIESRRPIPVVLSSSRAVYGEGLYHCHHCGEVSPVPRDTEMLRRAVWDPVCPICGGVVEPIATHEDAPTNPGSVYAATKLAQEHFCSIVGNAYGLPITILRYFNVYGPGQSLSNPYTGILSTFFARAQSGRPIEVYEDGQESRDFVFIDDVVEATRRALLNAEGQSQPLVQVLNIGTGIPISIAELAGAMLRVGDWDAPVHVTGAYRLGDVRHVFADTSRAKRVLGLTAGTSLDDGLRQWLNWAERGDYQDATEAALGLLAERGLYRTAEGC